MIGGIACFPGHLRYLAPLISAIIKSHMDLSNSSELSAFREKVLHAIHPIKHPVDPEKASSDLFFTATRTKAGRSLPENYLVFFPLVDLLKFKDQGQWEKTAWSVPIEYKDNHFLIEHRKFGIGVFAPPNNEVPAEEVTQLLKKGIRLAEPFFEHLASKALKESKLNVKNNSYELYGRFQYYLTRYKKRIAYALKIKSKKTVKKTKYATMTSLPVHEVHRQINWLAIAVIEAFYSWTEHVFIHLAILQRKLLTGEDVVRMTKEDWSNKFKLAVSINDPKVKKLYDALITIRQQVRNHVAHGSFGKQGEAFSFHSGAGAVPLSLPHKRQKARFAYARGVSIENEAAISIIEIFIKVLWSGERLSAKFYIQDANFPSILTMAVDGQYEMAMHSEESMKKFVDYLGRLIDRNSNMDF